MEMDKFGARISNYRKEINLTQEEFANRLGVTSQAVSKWERGQSIPDVNLLGDICGILNVNANELLGLKQKSKITESNDATEQQRLLRNLYADPLEIIFGNNLIPVFIEGIKTKLIAEKRIKFAKEYGVLIPVIRIQDNIALQDNEYCFLAYDKILYRCEAEVINEDTYNNLIDKFFTVSLKNYSAIMNRQIVKIMVDNLKDTYPAVVEGLIPDKISYYTLQKVLSGIIDKEVGIHNLIYIIEKLEDEIIVKGNQDINQIVDNITNILNTGDRISSLLHERSGK